MRSYANSTTVERPEVDNGTRNELLLRLAETVGSVASAHPTRVAVDGPPAAGKTTLADDLAEELRAQGREVIRATIEGFLYPRAVRYRRGEYSSEGCYFDTHNYDALKRVLLDPLGPEGGRRFLPAVYDRRTDSEVSQPWRTAPDDAVLLFDGVFLLRPEVIDRWDLSIFVSTSFERTVERAVIREQGVLTASEVDRRWRERYIPSQQFYFTLHRPSDRADILVHNDDLQNPRWEIRGDGLGNRRE